ncbi:protein transport protein YIF1 [Nematocida ausubeli]|uniref:Protein YIF1 n=1 Tax=Nematocida ausubeli (strain ATCC PRA-371 / ERTm2) TaxID=1913371 RepID=A0A086J0Y0_NEMA1|nr:uncharacterized protein NESG_01782 [Nematocida ausubeli]KAI5137203.1 protein transport protein YIF1 [Nematocida ausubeli]KAI5137405.1 protein transport protein YIF1 [Nematocida ausubeli]KAI5138195.1 protein transport protein YIF1 [Nematocida ausubeli]KAI5146607.1 protein transport protein YIF1 [Nematocida ausubeli]KAI5150954.1 protein transport protein YIF1 [Nematocida ausubeli]
MEFQMDMQKQAISLGSTYINRAVSFSKFEIIKRYFQIDNSYICHKLAMIIYPYTTEQWSYTTDRDITGVLISQPDMYIPLMAIISYILCISCEMELNNTFTPTALGNITTKAFLMGLLESAVIKSASFFFYANINITDIIAFVGYKYVTVILIRLISYICNIIISKVSAIYLTVSFCLFLGRSLKCFLILNEHEILVKKRKMYFLFLIVLMEGLFLLLLK